MKKFFVAGMISLCSIGLFAQTTVEPIVITDATARKISKDGKWVGCYGFSIVVYNVEDNTQVGYPECSIGNGNSVALDGTVVGVKGDVGVFMKEGKIIEPEILFDYGESGINGITSDGSRIVGYVKNPVLIDNDDIDNPYDAGIPEYIPFYSDLTTDGEIEKINLLPFPEEDFLGYPPMRVTGTWISDDGKTILAKMVDSYGRFEEPILIQESANGEWSYSTPTKAYFNPGGIILPENPWLKFPKEPNYKDYMTPLRYQAYLEALNNYFLNGGEEPDPFIYMGEENAQKYLEAEEEYEQYFYDHIDEINEYEAAYRKLLETSIYFGEGALEPKGEYFSVQGVNYNEEGSDAPSKVFVFNTSTGEAEIIKSKYPGLQVNQLLSNGTILAYTGLFTYDPLNAFIYIPGEADFMQFSDYLSKENPQYAEWLNEVFPNGEGILSASEDLSVFAGGLDILSVDDESRFPDSIILSYVLTNVNGAGIEVIENAKHNGIYSVFNLQGVKVMETRDKNELKNIGKGLFIINGKKVIL